MAQMSLLWNKAMGMLEAELDKGDPHRVGRSPYLLGHRVIANALSLEADVKISKHALPLTYQPD